ncbi:MAG: hypothetical protein FWD12_11925, partial [Alphaproteobacteria bacterium]|nr:hypothetical protein [Alphaproteobacteria bacterium]
MPEDARYQAIVGQAAATVDGEWRNTGLTRGKIDGLVHDARAADKAVTSFDQMQRSPRATPAQREFAAAKLRDARNAADAAWGKVGTEVENYLRSQGTGHPYPEGVVRQHVEDIKKQYAHDPKVKSAVDSAYRSVTTEWRAQGWTRDTLGKIVGMYDSINKDQRAVATAQASADARLPALQNQLGRGRTMLREEIERQLDDVAGSVPPDQREMAIGARGTLIQQNGPRDQAFADIVDEAAYNKLVQPGVDAVSNAYQSGGAKAGAEALRQHAENVSPEIAARLVEASQTTIRNIAADIKNRFTGDGTIVHEDVAGVFANVATATDYAARSTHGAQVTADVARIMVPEIPRRNFVPKFLVAQGYQQAVMQSVGSGTGATLALEMAVQLKEAGRIDEAEGLVGATRAGVELLSRNIKDGVNEFGDATADISQLRADWAPTMTRDQLDQATVKFVAQHGDILPNFDRTYNAIDGLGYGAVRTGLALDAALPRLLGLDGIEGGYSLPGVRNDFAGAKETQFAVALSQKAKDEVLRMVLDQEANGGAGANQPSSASRTRSFIKEFVSARLSSWLSKVPASLTGIADLELTSGPDAIPKSIRDIFTGQKIKIDPKKTSFIMGGLNGLGAALSGYQIISTWNELADDPNRLLDLGKAVYYTIGFGKETTELLAVATQRGYGFLPASLSRSVLAKSNRTGLALEPGWVRFAAYYKIGGGVIDAAFAAEAAARGDLIEAGLYSVGASGGVLMGAGSVAASETWLGAWGGPAGAGLTLAAALGLYFYNDAKTRARLEGQSAELLEAAGYRPQIARALASYLGGTAGPAIGATAQHFGVSPDRLMERLNRMDPGKVHDLVRRAKWLNTDGHGGFVLTAKNDDEVWGPDGGHLYNPQDKNPRGL